MHGAIGRSLLQGEWTPRNLGGALLALWDADRADLMTFNAAKVSGWTDCIGGRVAVQGTDASRPTYSATSFNGNPSLSFDGTDDSLQFANTTGLPLTSTACVMWAVFDQEALAADTTSRHVFSYGAGSAATSRVLRRVVVSGVNRGNVTIGDNSTTASAGGAGLPELSGRGYIIGRVLPASAQAVIRRSHSTLASVVPATGVTRTVIGGNTSATTAALWQGKVREVGVATDIGGDALDMLVRHCERRMQ